MWAFFLGDFLIPKPIISGEQLAVSRQNLSFSGLWDGSNTWCHWLCFVTYAEPWFGKKNRWKAAPISWRQHFGKIFLGCGCGKKFRDLLKKKSRWKMDNFCFLFFLLELRFSDFFCLSGRWAFRNPERSTWKILQGLKQKHWLRKVNCGPFVFFSKKNDVFDIRIFEISMDKAWGKKMIEGRLSLAGAGLLIYDLPPKKFNKVPES